MGQRLEHQVVADRAPVADQGQGRDPRPERAEQAIARVQRSKPPSGGSIDGARARCRASRRPRSRRSPSARAGDRLDIGRPARRSRRCGRRCRSPSCASRSSLRRTGDSEQQREQRRALGHPLDDHVLVLGVGAVADRAEAVEGRRVCAGDVAVRGAADQRLARARCPSSVGGSRAPAPRGRGCAASAPAAGGRSRPRPRARCPR